MNLYNFTENYYLLNFEGNLSTKSPSDFAILPDELNIIDNKYIASIDYSPIEYAFIDCYGNLTDMNYKVASAINEVSEEQKAIIDAQIALDERKANEFDGRNIRIFGSMKLIETNSTVAALYTKALGQDSILTGSEDVPTINPQGQVTGYDSIFYVYTNMLLISEYDKLKVINGVTIETYTGSINDTAPDGSLLYLIPQVL